MIDFIRTYLLWTYEANLLIRLSTLTVFGGLGNWLGKIRKFKYVNDGKIRKVKYVNNIRN